MYAKPNGQFTNLVRSCVSLILSFLLAPGPEATAAASPSLAARRASITLSAKAEAGLNIAMTEGNRFPTAAPSEQDERKLNEDKKEEHGEDVDVTLVSPTTPSSGVPGVDAIAVTGENFPKEVTPVKVKIHLAPKVKRAGPQASTSPTSIEMIAPTTWRFVFTIPASVNLAKPTEYEVRVSGRLKKDHGERREADNDARDGEDEDEGRKFDSSNAASLTVVPVLANPGGPYTGNVGQPITFDGSKSIGPPGQTLSYAWNFGDNTTGTGVTATHVYGAAGTFTVSLTVTDTSGGTNTATTTATITAPSAMILSVDPNSGYPGQQTLGTVGSIFLTGHDPDFHAVAGPNTVGAVEVNKAAINFITDPRFNTFAARGIHKFLYATSSISPPSGHVDGTNGVIASGYVLGTDFDRADASALVVALGQLGTQYDALVVASDFGGILTQAELDVLDAHSADLINFLNQGGGVYAMAEPTPAFGGLASSGFFGFLPFAVSSTPLGMVESGNSLTSFGVTLGLTNADINGNFFHTVFTSTGGLNIVDTDPSGETLSLAGRGKVTAGGTGSVIITGQFTHFLQGTTQVSFGPGITVGTVTVSDSTHLVAQISIDPNAIPGGRTVTVTTGNEVAALPDGFTVLSAPQLLTINPNTGQQGQANLVVTLTGQNTHFAQGVTIVDFGLGIAVGSVTVTDATHLTAQLTIDPTAIVGGRTVTATTGSEIASLANGFLVTTVGVGGGAKLVFTIQPANGAAGTALANVVVQVQDFSGNVVTSSSASITITSTPAGVSGMTTAAAASGVATFSNLVFTTAGSYTLTASSAGLTSATSNAFTISAAASPTLLSISPNSGLNGQSLQVTITGQGTHFQQGVTTANFGPGVGVGGGIAGGNGPVTVTSPTTATALLAITGNAPTGSRIVSVSTGTEQESLFNGFTVSGPASILFVSPNFGSPGQTLTVTIQGSFTHFLQGVSMARFGAGISVGGAAAGTAGPITVTGLTSATAQLTIGVSASVGPRAPITVTTGTEVASWTSPGFFVLSNVTGSAPAVMITSPTEGSEVTSLTTVTGTVVSPNLAYWTLSSEGSGSTTFTQFATGTTGTVSGTLDPTILLNGMAQIQLTAIDQSGQSASVTVNVVVTRNAKVGNFTLSFNDLTIPVAGIPIQIIRTYDSRLKASGDFGFGWSLSIKTTKVDVNSILGDNWTGTVSGGLLPTYCIQPPANDVVSVRLEDGTTYQFAPTLTSATQCSQIAPPSTVDMAFTPIGTTPPNATLTAPAAVGLFVNGTFPGPIQLLDLSTVAPVDPDQFVLTLPTGQQLQISRTSGIQSITDTNNNTLTFSANGITSSAGKSVTFARDAQSRITTITDPLGNTLTYAYDGNGDLSTFTDQLKNVSAFAYDGNHNLVSFNDPRGIQPIRNVYDDSGRLIQEIDAFGHVIDLTHNLAASTETVSDFLGNVTTYVYDAHGNIISETDALGGLATATYDSHDNKVMETNALRKTRTYTYDANNNRVMETDPLGNTTKYTYNSRNQIQTITDALSRVTTNTYDANGNLVSTLDAAGNTTSYTYNAQGLRQTLTDSLGGVTSYVYDSAGNLTQQTDALGNITRYVYDANGNKVSDIKTRTTASGTETLLTSYQYDAQNRLTQTTYPDASTTQIQYNSIGKQSATINQLGRQTSYQYDAMGRLTLTAYPDGTTESATYDADGNRIGSADRGGRTTSYTYDALKRLVKTTFADGASTSTTYDSIGEVSTVTDARGNVTQYQYDDAGRRTKVTDALTHVTSFAYDSVGNQISATDANTNTTQYQYDRLNRRTNTIYPDTTSDSVAHDALGRTTTKTDQAGLTTQFLYDKLGRLIQVADALGQLTKYTYDEVGNRTSQTDSNNHTTTFAYDQLGRRTRRTLPLGMFEAMIYDAAGNLASKTDFNGKTTMYVYDSMSRLTTKTPDASFSAPAVSFTYTQSGQRSSMTDASGTTNYFYDLRDRLTRKTAPVGTLTYTYDGAGNLTSITSSNTNGTSVYYSYDALNRLSTLVDNRLASATTTYTYDSVGNLQSYTYPNGVQTAYTYNTLNRVTGVSISKGAALASYGYQLGRAGNRTQVSELSGRTVTYTYDSLYRLMGEAIAVAAISGSIGYLYDHVGNRQQRTSTVAPVPSATYSYDANDRLAGDAYDAAGNTTASDGNTYAYDFENRLISQNTGAVTIVYDGDGNRASKTVGGVTTNYLVDDRNLTGYAQVLEELSGGVVQRVYTYGLNRISQSQASGTSFYEYDGQGSVRILTDSNGAVTDRYDYDAFGNILNQAGSTPNAYFFTDEQLDLNLSLYYLRERYLDPNAGRFRTMDAFDGLEFAPLSLNKYAYTEGNPIMNADPNGDQSIQITSLTLTLIADFPIENVRVPPSFLKKVESEIQTLTRAAMREQLQEQRGRGNRIHIDSRLLYDLDGKGVTTSQANSALDELRANPAIKNSEQVQADAALSAAKRWVSTRPPAGISDTVKKSFYFNPLDLAHTKSFDIENIYGDNLKR